MYINFATYTKTETFCELCTSACHAQIVIESQENNIFMISKNLQNLQKSSTKFSQYVVLDHTYYNSKFNSLLSDSFACYH